MLDSDPAVRKELVEQAHWESQLAEVLRELGHERAWVVHGDDGMDEVSTTGITLVSELKDGKIRSFEITPEMMELVDESGARVRPCHACGTLAHHDLFT